MSQHHHSTGADRIAKKKFKDECAANDLARWLSGCTIGYDAAWNDFDDPRRFQHDHFFPASTHPELYYESTNWQLACAECNEARSNTMAIGGLGIPSRRWVPTE